MELNNIDQLLSKYFSGETSIEEEKELVTYFNSSSVDPSLMSYQPLFAYLASDRQSKSQKNMELNQTRSNPFKWFSIAAVVLVFLGIAIYFQMNMESQNQHGELGTFDDPEVALKETQKALALLSEHVNTGIESVQYVQTYEDTRDRIFIESE